MRRSLLLSGAAASVFMALGFGGAAQAQVSPAPTRPTTATPGPEDTKTTAQTPTQVGRGPATSGDANSVEEVVVTGSFIRGAAEQAALPVQVVSQEELSRQGNPSTVELVKQLPSVGGVIGDANGFAAGRTEGVSNINLRGLGASRTLVLLNGRRLPNSSAGNFIDVNMISPAAIGRVEVLKDGAAATYGSDAIGGVVNFITRSKLKGFDVGIDYSRIEGSDGDLQARAAYGFGWDKIDGFVAASYQHRSQLKTIERDFATPKFTDQAGAKSAYLYNPQGGWSSAANPGTYIGGTAFNANFLDPGCPALGGELQISSTQCLFRYGDYYHLVEDTNLYQAYGELNFHFNEKTKLHVEAMAGATEVFHIDQSTSYGPNQFPNSIASGGVSPVQGQYFIPATNPGLATLLALNPALAAANPIARTSGVLAHPFYQRPIGVGGNPLYDYDGQEDKRYAKQYRVSADLSGEWDRFGGIGYDLAATYGRSDYDSTNPDFLVDRLELGYRGLASKQGQTPCSLTTGVAGTGNCFYFNPFSTGVAVNSKTGQVNPQFTSAVALDPRVVNDPNVIQWIYGDNTQRTKTRNDLVVVDAVANGKFPLRLWADEPVAWAVGYQYRRSTYHFSGIGFTDNVGYPCIDSIITGTQNCAVKNGPYTFYGNYQPADTENATNAVFAEIDIPVTKSLQANFAIRHEEDNNSDTTNPKFSARWQVTPILALRASIGTTFRAPPQVSLIPNATTGLSFVSQTTSYRPFDNYGNANLQPESATTYSAGAIVNWRGLSVTADYWRFEFDNPLTSESGNPILNAIFPTGLPNNCANPAYAALISRVTFSGACAPANIVRTRTNQINGAPVMTDGMDLSADYRWREAPFGGRMNFGADASYVFDYTVGAQVVEGITTVAAYNAVGKLNYQLGPNSIPRWKGNAFAEYTLGRHNLRITLHYINDMTDQRDSLFTSTNSGQGVVTAGKKIDSWLTTDIVYRVQMPMDMTATFLLINVTDEDPPFARLDYSYDPFTANPLGRVIKLGLNKRF